MPDKNGEQNRYRAEEFFQKTLDSLLLSIAILEEGGAIIAVNAAWNTFARENGLEEARYGPGANYLLVCDRATGDGAEEASLVAGGIRDVIAGRRRDFYLEYPCHSPTEPRWFSVRISRFEIDGAVRTVVTHDNITQRKLAQIKAQEAYRAMDDELKVVGEIQRSLLPARLPRIPTLDLAAYYQPSQRAGGDYYDFFPLPLGKWGIFLADVSGHGTPAAVLMAVTHCIAHTHPGPPTPPGEVLGYLNRQLETLYTRQNENFVTAFYGIYDPAERSLTYACAGHNPPRLKRFPDGTLLALDRANGFPLGITSKGAYGECVQQLQPGDQIIFYTDGITDAQSPEGKLFGTERLDHTLGECPLRASALLDSVLRCVEGFTAGRPADDDRALIVALVS